MRKHLIEDCDKLSIRDLKAVIPKNVTEITLEVGSQNIIIVGRLTNLKNGYRYFIVCSQCEKPYVALYRTDLGQFECRNCVGLVYCSTRTKQVRLGQYEHEKRRLS